MTQVAQKLEHYSWFPYVAWTLSIVFAIFVGSLALELRGTAASLEQSSITLEQRLQTVDFQNRPATPETNGSSN